jgi:hypothetical protein
MEPEGSIPCSQEPFTGSCPEACQSDPVSLRSILILSTHLHPGLKKERDHWEDQDVGGWTILKWILERMG